MEEKVLGVIPNASLKTGFIRWESYTLVATTRRLIAAKIRKDLIKEESKIRAEQAKSEGKGRFKQYLSRVSTAFTFANRYLEMNPDEILKETDKNFYIMPDEILKVKFKQGMVDEDGRQNSNTLSIVTKTKKFNFSFNSNVREASSLLGKIGH